MDSVSDQCWARIESLRYRMKSICHEADPDEIESVDAELIELREVMCGALKAFENDRTHS
ncbi:hypothetical protein [Sphingomonas sp. LY160]|uniref:hypothetical protein n=1 Tax=Sphingomonas sp. LY160 TaxID=3095342 RepID=UPI002ADEF84D|nr:hypothetical protein [Sphingomonas sp. LY160]MEA1070913.1 hypothetical protein [Sphingomonas sp. LY160]